MPNTAEIFYQPFDYLPELDAFLINKELDRALRLIIRRKEEEAESGG